MILKKRAKLLSNGDFFCQKKLKPFKKEIFFSTQRSYFSLDHLHSVMYKFYCIVVYKIIINLQFYDSTQGIADF